jgi:hypothetical protein
MRAESRIVLRLFGTRESSKPRGAAAAPVEILKRVPCFGAAASRRRDHHMGRTVGRLRRELRFTLRPPTWRWVDKLRSSSRRNSAHDPSEAPQSSHLTSVASVSSPPIAKAGLLHSLQTKTDTIWSPPVAQARSRCHAPFEHEAHVMTSLRRTTLQLTLRQRWPLRNRAMLLATISTARALETPKGAPSNRRIEGLRMGRRVLCN